MGATITVSEETRLKMRMAKLGKKHTPETKAKMSASQKGKVFTEVTREKLRQTQLGRKHTPEALMKMRDPNKPKKIVTEAAKRNMSLSRLGNHHSSETIEKIRKARKAKSVTIDGTIYDSVYCASIKLTVTTDLIYGRIKSKRHPTWKYVETSA